MGWSGYTPATQAKVLNIYRQALRSGWEEVHQRFLSSSVSGPQTARALAYLMDELISVIYEFGFSTAYPSTNLTTAEQMAVIATGGYGRGTLAPYSDIDLMFLLPYKITPHTEQIIEYTLYSLWDIGLKVGHATRSIDETLYLANQDLTIRTSLLDARWLWGNKALFDEFMKRFQEELIARSGHKFVEGKLAERDDRHRRMGDTRYVLEPNIKDGKGASVIGKLCSG